MAAMRMLVTALRPRMPMVAKKEKEGTRSRC
jgi:hypothetical protein